MLLSLFMSLPMVVAGIISLEVFLVWLRCKDRTRGWLLVWAMATTVLYACHDVFFHRVLFLLPVSDTLYTAANLMVFPFYLIYISHLTDIHPLSRSRSIMAFVVGLPLFASACVGVVYAAMTQDDLGHFLRSYLYLGVSEGWTGMASVQVVLHECCHVLFALQVAVVAVVGVRKIRRYNLQLNQLYADTENKSLHGIKVLLYLLVAASVLAVLVNHLGRHRFDGSLWLALPSLAFSALVFSIGWAGMFRRFSIRDMEEVVSCREENEDSACQEVLQPMASERLEREGGELLPQEELQEQEPEVLEESLGDRIERLMREEKVFLQHDLRLDDVARMLNTNRTYLLKAISETKGMTFKEYVNRLRIAHATQLMADNPQLTKSEVATASGYNTVSSFYRNYNLYAKK